MRFSLSDRNLTGLLLAILCLSGCTLLVPPAPPPAPEPPQETRQLPTATELEIGRLLTEAELALAEKRLTTPVDDNAYLRYLRILALDARNEAAQRGISTIVETYLTWALEAAEAGRMSRARRFLTSASSVDEQHPGIESIGHRIAELSQASRERHALPARELSARSAAVIEELRRLARLADERQALVVISARSDAEGRWIYQQMNGATPLRLRARLELSGRPMIRMVY